MITSEPDTLKLMPALLYDKNVKSTRGALPLFRLVWARFHLPIPPIHRLLHALLPRLCELEVEFCSERLMIFSASREKNHGNVWKPL